MKKASIGALFALLLASRVHAQAADAGNALPPLTGLDASIVDASVLDASAADASARDASAARDASVARDAGGPLDLNLPEQGCSLAHGGDLAGALPLLLALALIRRRRA